MKTEKADSTHKQPKPSAKDFIKSVGKIAPQPSPVGDFSPVLAIASVFRLRRDLAQLVKRHVLPDSGLTLEEADLLLALFGAAKGGWTEIRKDEEGYVSFRDLKASLVHSPAALTRRVAAMKSSGLIESRKIHEGVGPKVKVDKKMVAVRITEGGIVKAQSVFERYCRLSVRLLADLPEPDKRALLRINEAISQKARWSI